MSLIEGLLQKSTVLNSKGGVSYSTSYNSNLDLFSKVNRFSNIDYAISNFRAAYEEDKILAVANLLYLLDIRKGKGERNLFKQMFVELCNRDKEMAIIVLTQIGELGRWDYVLAGLNTPIRNQVIYLIKKQLKEDILSENPSLLAKWLPSHRTHNKNNSVAKELIRELEITEKEYRTTLTSIRKRLNLIETKLTNKDYDNIDFEQIPTKAMLKYRKALEEHCGERYKDYLEKVNSGEKKINVNGLYAYEIIEKINDGKINKNLASAMWNNQKDIFEGNTDNILVMADTSGSMTWKQHAYETSIGMAIYTAQRNHGIFKDHFMTFSTTPTFHKLKGTDINTIFDNIETINSSTNIDSAFELLLEAAKEQECKQEDMPSHLIIISDMEFDEGCYSQGGTNFSGWKKAFEAEGYKLPKIIFWNLGTEVLPVTKFDNDVCMITGFSTSVLESMLNLENFTPYNAMIKALTPYIEIIEKYSTKA